MERVVSDLFRFFDTLALAIGNCSTETLAMIAVGVVAFGYFVLKGSPVRGG